MKVAIVHDWLYTWAGAERVLEQMFQVWPEADLFSLFDFLSDEDRKNLGGRRARTTFLQRMPYASRHHRLYLPFMPLAIEQFDFNGYDLVVSNSYAVAKGVITPVSTAHLCMCQSPMRYAWDMQAQYLRETGNARGLRGIVARILLHHLRIWDVASSCRPDLILGNSSFVQKRIRKVWGRQAGILHPPVDLGAFPLSVDKGDSYVTASRLVPYKRIDLVVKAFAEMPDRKLVVIGDGPEMRKIRSLAGPNVEILGQQPHETLRHHLQTARAFIFAAEEDFGIAPVEALACGTPVIAFGRGGIVDTVDPVGGRIPPTGVFFQEQSEASLIEAVKLLEQGMNSIDPNRCRERAMRFTKERFRQELKAHADQLLAE